MNAVVDPVTAFLMEQTLNLEKKLEAANAKLAAQDKELTILYACFARPYALQLTQNNIHQLAELILDEMGVITGEKELIN